MSGNTISRRGFLATLPCVSVLGHTQSLFAAPEANQKLERELGVTTGSFSKLLTVKAAKGKLVMLDLPKIMRDELDLRVLDLMTATLPSLEADYCEQFRTAAEKANCIITNLKMNQRDLDMASADAELRKQSLDIYKKTIDAAARLGCRWVRPASGTARPDLKRLTAGFRELIDYAAPKKITLLIENNGWLRDDPEAIPAVIKEVGAGLASQPDTGNWTPKARYDGLAKAFPSAVTCDFKAFKLGPNGEHADYDLRKCFDIAWQAGFRGPWCFELFHEELDGIFKQMGTLRDLLRKWMKEADTKK